jgi:hypothetical protein
VTTVAECTVPEKILLAAFELEEQGQSPFSAESLVVAAWQKFPKTFGLKGYSDVYPDSNKVLASIMGVKGLAHRGWLVKMGQKLYAMTREGRQSVRRLLNAGEPTTAEEQPVKLSRDQEKFLLGLLNSTAVQKYQEGTKNELTFADACRYWGITESMNVATLDAKLDHLRGTLGDLDRLLSKGNAVLSNGRSISSEDLDLLCAVRAYLEERFSRHLSLLRNRVERT